MDSLHNFAIGLMAALQPTNLFYCFIGCVAGTIVGELPSIGPMAAVALPLPTTFSLNPVSSIIMPSGVA
jgi:TctA family transporter